MRSSRLRTERRYSTKPVTVALEMVDCSLWSAKLFGTKVYRPVQLGWMAEPGAGSAVMVNGARVCNVDTMQALYRAGFAARDDRGCWQATPSGPALRDRIDQSKPVQ